MIPYGRQQIDDDDIAAVVAVLRGDWLTQGPAVEDFEAALAATTGARHVVAFANGTLALHAAMWAARVGPGDNVVTSPLSFVASASCALWVGAQPAFVDIDPKTLNLDVGAVEACDITDLECNHRSQNFANAGRGLQPPDHRARGDHLANLLFDRLDVRAEFVKRLELFAHHRGGERR